MLPRIQQPLPSETPGQAPSLHENCHFNGLFYVHCKTHGTYGFTSHPKDEAISVSISVSIILYIVSENVKYTPQIQAINRVKLNTLVKFIKLFDVFNLSPCTARSYQNVRGLLFCKNLAVTFQFNSKVSSILSLEKEILFVIG